MVVVPVVGGGAGSWWWCRFAIPFWRLRRFWRSVTTRFHAIPVAPLPVPTRRRFGDVELSVVVVVVVVTVVVLVLVAAVFWVVVPDLLLPFAGTPACRSGRIC